MLVNAVMSALVNLVVLVVVPFLVYFLFHKRRGRSLSEVARRAGLRVGEKRYVGYCMVFAAVQVVVLVFSPPPLEPFTREGSAQHAFAGLGLRGAAIPMALLYGFVQTGFSEEFFFRGLIAGSLSRRLPAWGANVVQSLVFLLPHLALLSVMPEVAWLLGFVFVIGLFLGWVRLRSGSILGPVLLHGILNVTVCLSVSIRSAS